MACGCLLTLISVTEHQKLAARFEAIGASHVLSAATVASFGNGLTAGGTAFLLGKGSGWLWGI